MTVAQTLDRVQGKHRGLVLVVGVEVRAMVQPPTSTNIRMTIPKNVTTPVTPYIVRVRFAWLDSMTSVQVTRLTSDTVAG